MTQRPTATFIYLNHNGHRAERTIEVDSLEFIQRPGFGYQPGWFLSGWDASKGARRSFALSRVELPEGKRAFQLLNWGLRLEGEKDD